MIESSFCLKKDFPGHSFSKAVYAFSNRSHGNMSLCYADTRFALKNREIFLSQHGINYQHLICAKQVHAHKVRCVNKKDAGRGALVFDSSFADTDGFITKAKGVPISIFSADCLSIFLYDPVKVAIGLVHAGWRSTQGKVAIEALKFMRQEFDTDAKEVLAVFGPSIRECCYEVGSEFKAFFPEGLSLRESKYYLDLAGINTAQLIEAGIKKDNISDSKICTVCGNEEYFSYRKEGSACGRIISVAMLI